MKKVLRFDDNRAYWDRRWAETQRDADAFASLDIYPIRYAEMVMTEPSQRVLEIGAGLGRVLKHYHLWGHEVIGIERSKVAVDLVRRQSPEIDIRHGDVLDLPFKDGDFDVVLAFGLFHNIEDREDVQRGLGETARCLRAGGRFCISMRPNNVEMRLNELYWLWRNRARFGQKRTFHKWLVREAEFNALLRRHDLWTDRLERARNVSFLYRLPFLREARGVSETEHRAGGYTLNALGRTLDSLLMSSFPAQFCNVLVFIGRKGR